MLDFTIYSDTDRKDYIEKELSKKSHYSNKELETMANYILFGKDENNQNAVERGEVEIETKYKSYSRKKEESLEGILEDQNLSEKDFRPLKRTIYKNPKPTLDKNLPELKPLLKEIEQFENLVETLKLDPSTDKTLLYKMNHSLIELKRQQYTIQDAVKGSTLSTCLPQHYTFAPIGEDLGVDTKPLGLKIGNLTRFINPREDKSNFIPPTSESSFDFRNPSHIYLLIESYSTLKESSEKDPYSNTKYLLETLDFYAKLANFSKARELILKGKESRLQNSEINIILEKNLQIHYNENYISTIYKGEICRKIAEAATLHFSYWELRNTPEAWKKCACCGQYKLRNSSEFIRKKTSSDGFSSRCKECEHKKRKEAK